MLTVLGDKSKVDYAGMSLADVVKGNCADIHFTLKIYEILRDQIEEKGMASLVDKLINRAIPAYARMEYEGFHVSREKLEEIDSNISRELEDLENDLWSIKTVKRFEQQKEDKNLNLNSSKQLIELLYSEDGFDLQPVDITDTGAPSTNADSLKFILNTIKEEIEKREGST